MITKIFSGCAMSGLIADSRTMVDKARVEGQVIFSTIFMRRCKNYVIR